MKKQILISSAIAAGILGATTVAIINDVSAEPTKQDSTSLVAVNNTLNNTPNFTQSKNETVYVMTDENGEVKSKFIGSSLYTGAEELPFEFKITYFLDGNETSAKDLKGKSGHVKITYTYHSTAKYLGKDIPFVALTGLTLDNAHFKNLKLTNGKIIAETSDISVITGYSITGLNTNLGTDLLPESFILEADVTDFNLSNSYTVFANEFLADIDTSKLNNIDSLTNSIYQLSDAIDQIISGSTELSNGILAALDGTKTIYAGSTQLVDGLNLLVSNNDLLQYGANTIIDTVLGILNDAITLLNSLGITTEYDVATIDNYQDVYTDIVAKISILQSYLETYLNSIGLSETATIINNVLTRTVEAVAKVESLIEFSNGVIAYTDGVAQVALGASELSKGLGSLIDGETKLYAGSVTLKDGLTTFKTSGIDRLVNFATTDLTNFIANIRSSVSAAASYKTFGDVSAKSVRFIIKTPSI